MIWRHYLVSIRLTPSQVSVFQPPEIACVCVQWIVVGFNYPARILLQTWLTQHKKRIKDSIKNRYLLFSFIIYNCNSMHMSQIWQVVTNSIMLSYSIIPNSYRVIFPGESNLKFRFSHMFK